MPQTALPSTRNGSPTSVAGYVEKPIRIVTDPRTGAQTIRTFHGSQNVLFNLIPSFQNNGWATDFHCRNPDGSPEWELVCTIGLIWGTTQITDNPVSVWEIRYNKVEKDFLNAQNSLVASLTVEDAKILQNFLDNPPFPIPQTPPTDTSTTPATSLTTNGMTAYSLILQGVKSQKIYQPILKQTQTTSNIYILQASFTNVGKLLSTATIIALMAGNNLAQAIPPDPISGKTGFAYGWLVSGPDDVVSAFTKSQIIQEYEFGLWPTAMYNVPI